MGRGVLFLGPDEASQGGIAAVLVNYRKTEFWHTYRCRLYGTSSVSGSALIRIVSQAIRLAWIGPFLIARRPAVVSVHTASRRSFYRNFWYMCLVRALGIPMVIHVHPTYFGEFYRSGGAISRRMIECAVRWSAEIVVLSGLQKEDLANLFPGKPIRVIPNPVDTVAYCPAGPPPGQDNRPVILFMGWIVQKKGVYDIVDAMPLVLAKHPEARFVFAGNKEVDELKNLLSRLGMERHAEVPGWVSGVDKLALMRRSTMLLLPSYSEGIPNVILEAMATGLPVVASPVGGIPSIAEDRRTILFVEPGNPHSLAKQILALLDDADLRQRLVIEARAHVEANFSLVRISSLLYETYRGYSPW